MHLRRTQTLATLALVSLLPLATPLRACCDDFWSCAAAVATGGLSCAVENLINSIKNLIQNVAHLASTLGQQAMDVVNLAKSELSGAANDLRNLASQAESDFNNASQLAQSIVNEASRPQLMAPQVAGVLSTAGALNQRAGTAAGHAVSTRPGVPTPAPTAAPGLGGAATALRLDPPVDPQEMLAALRRAQQAVDALRPDLTQPINQVRQFATQAEQQAAAAASSAAGIAQSALLAPLQTLGSMLQDLVNHPEHIFDPSQVVDNTITQITNQAISTMTQVHDAVMQQAKGTLDMAQKPLQDALDRASVAKRVVDAMQHLQRTRSKAALDALNGVIPRQPMDARNFVNHVAAVNVPGVAALNLNQHHTQVMVPFNRIAASRLTARTVGTQLGAQIRGPWMNFKRLQATPAKPDPAAKSRVDQEIARRFQGMTPAQAAAEKQAMLNEARARFAKDPATLRKLEAMLNGDPVIQHHIAGPHGPMDR